MTGVFVIMNEWIDINSQGGSEIVGGNYFETESEAWDSLRIIAQAHDVDLQVDDTTFVLEDHTPSLTWEEFYIQELNKL